MSQLCVEQWVHNTSSWDLTQLGKLLALQQED